MAARWTSMVWIVAMVVGCNDYGVGHGIFGGNRGATTLDEDDDTGIGDDDGDDDDDDDGDDDDDDDDGDDDDGDDDDTGEDCDDDDDGDDDDDDDDDDNSGHGDGDDDCDDGDDDDDEGEADLPYDVRLDVGDTFVLTDAFAEEGPLPAEILSVTMDGGNWRLAEIASLTPFTVDQSDCDHEGNRDEGRDRIEVSWRNADGSEDEDHLDLRYCGR